jgi:hypothetical protein
MSIKVMTVAWEIPLPHADKLLLIALADQANDEGWCWPSVATLGRKCGMEDRSIRRVIVRLVQGGHVSVQARAGTSNNYLIHPKVPAVSTPDPESPPDAESALTDGELSPDRKSAHPGRRVSPPRTVGQGTPDRGSANPFPDPSLNPQGSGSACSCVR